MHCVQGERTIIPMLAFRKYSDKTQASRGCVCCLWRAHRDQNQESNSLANKMNSLFFFFPFISFLFFFQMKAHHLRTVFSFSSECYCCSFFMTHISTTVAAVLHSHDSSVTMAGRLKGTEKDNVPLLRFGEPF